jgi:hypothetical protein
MVKRQRQNGDVAIITFLLGWLRKHLVNCGRTFDDEPSPSEKLRRILGFDRGATQVPAALD